MSIMMHVQDGVTLLEVLAAVAIVGVVIGLAIAPSKSAFNDQSHFVNDKVQLRGILQQARNLARNQQECIQVTLSGQTLTMTGYKGLSSPCPAVGSASYSSTHLDSSSVSSVTFDSSVVLSTFSYNGTSSNTMVFNTQGGTDYSTPITMSLRRSIYSSTYTIMPLIGQIENN